MKEEVTRNSAEVLLREILFLLSESVNLKIISSQESSLSHTRPAVSMSLKFIYCSVYVDGLVYVTFESTVFLSCDDDHLCMPSRNRDKITHALP